MSNFDSTPLFCDPALFPGKNIQNIAKSNHIFPGKGRGDKDFISTYLDSSMAKVSPHYCLFFSILAIFRRKRGVKVGPKVLTLGPSLFHKYSNTSKNFQTVFLSARVLTLVIISTILNNNGGVSAQKPPKEGYFVEAESVRKNLEILNLTTTGAVLMKLTTIMYLHESVNRKALRARNSFFWLNLIASLVKLLYKLDYIWGSIPWKTTKNRFKMIATLTSLKLEPELLTSRVM